MSRLIATAPDPLAIAHYLGKNHKEEKQQRNFGSDSEVLVG